MSNSIGKVWLKFIFVLLLNFFICQIMGCGESKEKNKIAPDKEDDITPKIYLHNETIEDISVPSSQVPSTSTESSKKRHGT